MDEDIQSYFENHPDTDVFHFTADGFAFFKKDDAHNHANSLDDNEVRTISRDEIETE
ncbi:MAG: hypothetical protein H0X33_07105 [Taibaiella sp.]|nr:hypothetical protein [Taibaiella sp.]